jgi:hypothetical protein
VREERRGEGGHPGHTRTHSGLPGSLRDGEFSREELALGDGGFASVTPEFLSPDTSLAGPGAGDWKHSAVVHEHLRDAVEARVTLVLANGQLLRLSVPTRFSSPLVQQCFQALACALPPAVLHALHVELVDRPFTGTS